VLVVTSASLWEGWQRWHDGARMARFGWLCTVHAHSSVGTSCEARWGAAPPSVVSAGTVSWQQVLQANSPHVVRYACSTQQGAVFLTLYMPAPAASCHLTSI
jgi:hypothetical protein